MNVMMVGFLLFAIAFLLHLIIWKIRIPDNPARTIVIIFVLILAAGVLILRYTVLDNSMAGSLALLNFGECLHVALIFMSFLSTYYFVYGTLVDESPSMFTILNVTKAGEKGLPEKALTELITDDLFIKPRMVYLVGERMVCLQEKKYRLNSKGKKFIGMIKFFQNLMKLSIKAG
jgi:hypothetical protein